MNTLFLFLNFKTYFLKLMNQMHNLAFLNPVHLEGLELGVLKRCFSTLKFYFYLKNS